MNVVELRTHVEAQVKNILCAEIDVSAYIEEAVQRTARCLEESSSKYVKNDSGIGFSVYHSVQYCIFLYQLSRVAYEKEHGGATAEKLYYLNKVLNTIDVFYEVQLPSVWGCEHPLGSVLGRASYGDRFFFYQGCTVGGNHGQYPTLGDNVLMYSNSKILGKCTIGSNVIIAANTFIKGQDIPSNCMVFGQSPNLHIIEKSANEIVQMSSHIWKHTFHVGE